MGQGQLAKNVTPTRSSESADVGGGGARRHRSSQTQGSVDARARVAGESVEQLVLELWVADGGGRLGRGSRRPDEADADDALHYDRGARHDDAVRRRGRSEERLRARRRAAAAATARRIALLDLKSLIETGEPLIDFTKGDET